MGKMDLSKAERPTRARVGGADRDRARKFRQRFPPSAKRHAFIRNEILARHREPPVNPERASIDDPQGAAREIKQMALDMGADEVGVARFDPRFAFTQAGEVTHTAAIVYAKSMAYDCMADIGPASQAEVHRVYHLIYH